MRSFYKVVTDEGGRLLSAMRPQVGSHVVCYTPHEWTAPTLRGSKLFCFKNIKAAREFIVDLKLYDQGKPRIFRCKAKNAVTGGRFSAVLDQSCIEWFWNKGQAANSPEFYQEGSSVSYVFADEVMITKEVKT